MSQFLNQQLTNAGWDALSVALGGGRLTFFKMQAGSGTIANDQAIPAMTALVAPVCDIAITKYSIEGDGQITLFGNIASAQLDAGFTFRELGVFATIEQPVIGKGGVPTGPNIQVIPPLPSSTANPVVPTPPEGTALMYSYCNSYANSDYIPGKGETTDVVNTIQVTIKIDQAQNVVINIIAGQQMAVENIGPPSVGAGPWSYTQANVAYLKRLKAGAAMIITEDTNTITIGAKQLTADLDLYVANGNPDISPDFSTIQKAIDYLGQYLIPTTIRARIHVQKGIYTLPTNLNIYLNHPNALNITIQGPQNPTIQGTTLVSITGSTKNWSVTCGGFTDTSSISVNDWVVIDQIGGTTGATEGLAAGFFQVTAKTANTVTFRVPYNKASFSITGFSWINLTAITAIISTPLNTYGFVTSSSGVGLMQYIGIVAQTTPTATCYGFNMSGSGNLKFCGAAGFNGAPVSSGQIQCGGIGSWGDMVNCNNCGVSNCQNGFVAGAGGALNLNSCATSHTLQYGVWCDSGSKLYVTGGYSRSSGHPFGLISANSSTVIFVDTIPPGAMIIHRNDSWGAYVVGQASLIFGASPTLNILGNGSGDLAAVNFGYVGNSARISGSRIFNIPVGTISSSGALIA